MAESPELPPSDNSVIESYELELQIKQESEHIKTNTVIAGSLGAAGLALLEVGSSLSVSDPNVIKIGKIAALWSGAVFSGFGALFVIEGLQEFRQHRRNIKRARSLPY